MPLISDYNRDDEEELRTGSSGARGAATGGQLATPSKQQESAFVPWSRFVSANQDVSNREAKNLETRVQGSVDKAVQGRDNASKAHEDAVASNYKSTQQSEPAFGRIAPEPKAQLQAAGFGEKAATFGRQEEQQTAPQNGSFNIEKPAPNMAVAPGKSFAVDLKPAPAAPKFIDPDKLKTEVVGGKPITSGFELAGSKNLEEQMGSEAWSKLLGDSMAAQQQAKALGAPSGVEALLKSSGAQLPNSAFDAALIGGAGGNAFRGLSKQWGGDALSKGLASANQDAMDRWTRLMGDVDAASAARDREITAATDAMNQLAAKAEAAGVPSEEVKAADESKKWLQDNFPIAPQFETQDGLLDWVEDNRNGEKGANAQQGGYSNLLAWADQIYGAATQENIDKLYADLRRMTPEEYEAFKYGIVPSWMGQGSGASGFLGGKFFGLGNTGNRYKAETTGKPTAENQQFWSTWRTAMNTFYQVLAAIATAAATAVNPLAGAAVGAGLEAALAAEREATSGGAELEEDEEE